MQIVKPSVRIIQFTPNWLDLLVTAGTLCYKSTRLTSDSPTEDKIEFVRKLIKNKHESVIEHAVCTFWLVCDRGVSHEEVRHRIQSVSQESTRYCNYASDKFGNEIAVIEPPGLTDCQRHYWTRSVIAAEESYLAMIGDGVAPQIARSVLPTCLKTELICTMNFRELRHFLRLRTDKPAHPQMREVAIMLHNQIQLLAPVLIEDIPLEEVCP